MGLKTIIVIVFFGCCICAQSQVSKEFREIEEIYQSDNKNFNECYYKLELNSFTIEEQLILKKYLAKSLSIQDKYAEAINVLEEGLKLADQNNIIELQFDFLVSMGQINNDLDLDYAVTCFQNALDLQSEKIDIERKVMARTGLMNCQYLSGNYKTAEKQCLSLIKTMEENKASFHGNNLLDPKITLAGVYFMQGKLEEGILVYQEALDLFKNNKDIIGCSDMSINIGMAYLYMNELDSAKLYIHNSLLYARETKSNNQVYESYSVMVEYYKAIGDVKKAMELTDSMLIYYDKNMNEQKFNAISEANAKFEVEKTQFELEQEKLESQKSRAENKLLFAVSIGIALLFFLVLIMFGLKRKSNRVLREKKKELEISQNNLLKKNQEILKQKNLIKNQHDRISDSIMYSSRIQKNVLQSIDLFHKKHPENLLMFRPKDVVSGDFYWFYEDDNTEVYVLGDCTGHGVPGAFLSMLGVTILEKLMTPEVKSPSKLITDLNNEFYTRVGNHKVKDLQGVVDGMEVSVLFKMKSTSELIYSGSRQKTFIVDSEFNVEPLPSISFDIGSQTIKDNVFTDVFLSNKKVKSVVLLSDGIQDQKGEISGKKFFRKRVKNLILDMVKEPHHKKSEILNNSVNEWMGEGEQIDDMTLIFVST